MNDLQKNTSEICIVGQKSLGDLVTSYTACDSGCCDLTGIKSQREYVITSEQRKINDFDNHMDVNALSFASRNMYMGKMLYGIKTDNGYALFITDREEWFGMGLDVKFKGTPVLDKRVRVIR